MNKGRRRSDSRSRSRDKLNDQTQQKRQRRKFNCSGLFNVINEQKKFNKRLDNSELENANIKLKQKYPEEAIQAKLLTQHLSLKREERQNERKIEKIETQMEKQKDKEKEKDKIYYCTYVDKCKQKFKNMKDFMIHLNYHKEEEEEEKAQMQKQQNKTLKQPHTPNSNITQSIKTAQTPPCPNPPPTTD